MSRVQRTTLVAVLLSVVGTSVGGSTLAQSPSPDVGPAPVGGSAPDGPWPTGDELRRDLQDIGFVFRIDGPSGDWLGQAPPVGAGDMPALGLEGAGTRPAVASFDLQLIGGDPSLPLTAYMEVASRLPLATVDVDRGRRFIVDDLLEAPPETLEPCYASDWERGAALVTIDTETTSAHVRLAQDADTLQSADVRSSDVAQPIDLADCAALLPAQVAAELGDASSERVTITLGGEPPAFDPSETTLEGALVTVILTFHNESAVEQSLTFDGPLEATTGPVEPGGTRLIVVRQLQPGEFPFFSDTDPDGLRGVIHIEPPSPDQALVGRDRQASWRPAGA